MATLALTILPSKPTSARKFPVFIRISVKNDKSYIKTEYELDDVAQWYNGKVVAHNQAAIMNKRLLYELKRYKDRLQYIDNYEYYTASQLKAALTQLDKIIPDVRTFNEFFRARIKEMREEGRDSYAKMQEDTLKLFEKAEGSVPLIIMNHLTIEHFDRWMKIDGHTDGGRQIRLCHIKARINEAIKNGLVRYEIHPFAYTQIPTAEPRDLDLSVESIRKIVNGDVSHSKRLTFAKDMFLLSFYLGGANFADIVQINFHGNEIAYTRKKVAGTQKGASKTRIVVRTEASSIINKYIREDGKLEFGYKYSTKNLQCYINQCLKLLAKELNIKEDLTFYSARKSFAQFASDLGIPDHVIDYCLGHSAKQRGIIRFYTKVKQRQAEMAVNRVIEYIQNPDAFKDFISFRTQMQMMV